LEQLTDLWNRRHLWNKAPSTGEDEACPGLDPGVMVKYHQTFGKGDLPLYAPHTVIPAEAGIQKRVFQNPLH
jgi:hypothetical protein